MQWGVLAHVLEIQRRGWTSSDPLSELSKELLYILVPEVESSSLAERHSGGRAKGCKRSGVIWQGARVPTSVLWLWGVAHPDSPEGLVVTPMITATSTSGTPADCRTASSAMAGRFPWITIRISIFPSWICKGYSFCRRRSFLFWKQKVRGHCSEGQK